MQEFVGGDAGGAEFADDYACGGVGETRGVGKRGARCGGESENAEHGIACSGYVENLAAIGAAVGARFSDALVGHFKTCRGNVQRARRRLLEQAHSLFTAGDQHGFAAKVREQGAACVVERFFVGERLRQELSGFLGVADDRFCTTIGVKLRALRSDEYRNFEFVSGAQNFVGEIVGDDAFVVVGEDERFEIFHRSGKRAQETTLRFRMERLTAFAIDADDVLMARDDARLDRGDAARVGEQTLVGNICGAKLLSQRFTGLVDGSFAGTDGAEHFDARAQFSKIRGDVGGAAEAIVLLGEIDDGDGSFGRETRRGAPEVAVEHEVADDSDAFAVETRDEALEASGGLGEISVRSGHSFGDSQGVQRGQSGALVAWSMIRTGMSSRIG